MHAGSRGLGRVLALAGLTIGGTVLALAAARPAAAAEPAVSLPGTWYVLVHYQDDASANAEVMRWEDRVWTFEKKGSRLRWTEYPIVVLSDETGRFEGRHRVLAAWEPSPAQQAEILAGPRVNTRGSKSKSLRGKKDGSAWLTTGRMQVSSASAVGYFEDWRVEGLPHRPVFTRDDILGSARAEGLEGRTQFTTTEVSADGSRLRGTFVRDGTRHGTFQMYRTADIRNLESDKTPNEKQRERFEAEIMGGGDQ